MICLLTTLFHRQSATAHQQLLEKQVLATNSAISTLTENNAGTSSKQGECRMCRAKHHFWKTGIAAYRATKTPVRPWLAATLQLLCTND